jgi:hypothetical protein
MMANQTSGVAIKKVYCFAGATGVVAGHDYGQGIPGLPWSVTKTQARELGLLDVLNTAIQIGNYSDQAVQPQPAPIVENGA